MTKMQNTTNMIWFRDIHSRDTCLFYKYGGPTIEEHREMNDPEYAAYMRKLADRSTASSTIESPRFRFEIADTGWATLDRLRQHKRDNLMMQPLEIGYYRSVYNARWLYTLADPTKRIVIVDNLTKIMSDEDWFQWMVKHAAAIKRQEVFLGGV